MPERVTVLIEGKHFAYWSELELTLSLDSFSAVSFSAPFEPERKEFRETFRPFSFKPISVIIGTELVFTGTLVEVEPRADAGGRSVAVSGYALPGVLQDCTAPATTVPHEFKKLTLTQIFEKLCEPFGIGVKMATIAGAKFEKVKLEEDKKILEFMAELAKQRNIVISNTGNGDVLCWKAVRPGHPVAKLEEGRQPVSNIAAKFSPQDYFSEITGFASVTRKRGGAKYTAKNQWLTNTLRPNSFKLDDTDRGDAPQATRSRLSRMFGNMASWTFSDLATWRDPQGELWAPNSTIILSAPSAMIYRPTELLVRTVKLSQDAEKESSTLELVLPGSFTDEQPTELPWED